MLSEALQIRLRTRRFWLLTTTTLVLIAIYIALALIPLPYADPTQTQRWLAQAWWPWQLADLILTAGAFGRSAILSAGMIGLLFNPNDAFPNNLGKVRIGRFYTLLGLAYLSAPALLITIFLRAINTIPATLTPFLVTFLLLTIGSVITAILADRLQDTLNIGIMSVNSILILILYFVGLPTHTLRLLLGGAILLFVIAYLYSQRRTITVTIVDRSTHLHEEAELNIPYADDLIQLAIFIAWGVIGSLLLLVVGFFWGQPFDLNTPSLLVYGTLLLITGVSLFWSRYRPYPATFSPQNVANFLHKQLWIIPTIRPGDETAALLRQKLWIVIRYWLLFFALWYVVFGLMETIRLRPATATFSAGALAFLLFLTYSARLLDDSWRRIRALTPIDYQAGTLNNIYFVSSPSELTVHADLNDLPAPLRELFEEILLDPTEDNKGLVTLPIALVRSALASRGFDPLVERQRILKQGLWNTFKQDASSFVLDTLISFIAILVIFAITGFTIPDFGIEFLELLISLALTLVFKSGKIRLTLRIALERLYTKSRNYFSSY